MAKTDPVYAIGECHSEVDGHPEKWLACVTISIHFRMVASDPYVVVVMDIGYIHQTPPEMATSSAGHPLFAIANDIILWYFCALAK